jgi:hypothetical protein
MITTELFEKAGGREQAAKLCGVTEWATYKWDEDGIPSKHWRTFSERTGLTLEDVATVKPAKPQAKSDLPDSETQQ